MDAEDLYGLPLDEFVPRRGALAKALRAEKRRDDAARVAALRKPSIAAWAVNQLVRTQRDAVRALFEAGDGLRGAQENLLAGRGDGRALRAAGERERAAVDALVEAARGLLTSGGHELSAAVVERVDDTLHAAALDETAREQVRDGRLERELRHVGLGLGLGEAIAATPAPRAPRHAEAAPAPKSREPATRRGSKPATTDHGEAAVAKPSAAGRRTERERSAAVREEAQRAEREPATTAREEAQREEVERAECERAVSAREGAQREEAERAECERAAARKAARAAEAAARRRVDAAARALHKAERHRASAAQALRDADGTLTSARDDAEEAAAELARATAALDGL